MPPGHPPARRLPLSHVQGDNQTPSTATCSGLRPHFSHLPRFRLISVLEKTAPHLFLRHPQLLCIVPLALILIISFIAISKRLTGGLGRA